MKRLVPIALLLQSALALGAPSVSLVDGTRVVGTLAAVESKDGVLVAIIARKGGESRMPLRAVVGATYAVSQQEPSPDPFNLYLAGGDRLRGKVEGRGDAVTLASKHVAGLERKLAQVEAICVGTFFGQVQAAYRAEFEKQLRAGRDTVVVNRGSKPFPIRAVLLEVRNDAIVVRLGDRERELPRDKVYGFVRRGADPATPSEGAILARVHFNDGGRVTLPVESIGGGEIRAGGAIIDRRHVTRIDFLGRHIERLAAMNPVSADEIALFGKAPRWKKNEMILGGPMRMDGKIYANGVGVQAKSRLEYAVGGRWNRFFVRCGIDDAASREGRATFRVYGDGKLLKEVTRRRGEPAAVLTLDITGVERLVLEALPGDSYTSDLCNWAEARVY
ncbi:MAG: NPCBM/NEW2 domain-containing protein, partial [Planctomycetota bacterium]